MRDEFEKWFFDNYVKAGETVNLQMKADMWTGFQAARAQSGQGVPEGWSLTHIDDPATDGYLVKGPGISYCVWKDKEPWLYLFCEALATTPQPEGGGWVNLVEGLAKQAESENISVEVVFDDGYTREEFDTDISEHIANWLRSTKRPQPPQEVD